MNLSRYAFALLLCLPTAAQAQQIIDVYDDHGGVVSEYDAHWAQEAAQGVSVRIVGPCQSACTVLLGHIPRERICVMPEARFGFHLAGFERSTQILWSAYAPDIRQWIDDHGGLTHEFIWMSAPDIYRYFRKC
jgi:hypothetical protein